MGPNQSTTACTASGLVRVRRGAARAAHRESPDVAGERREVAAGGVAPERDAAEPSSRYSPAWARSQRTAALTSLMAAGKRRLRAQPVVQADHGVAAPEALPAPG